MMPTVLSQDGVRIMIYTDDHPPAHVHCYVGDGIVVVNLDEESTIRNVSGKLKKPEIKKARRVVKENLSFLRDKWNEIHSDE